MVQHKTYTPSSAWLPSWVGMLSSNRLHAGRIYSRANHLYIPQPGMVKMHIVDATTVTLTEPA
jgi:hypothetical protein